MKSGVAILVLLSSGIALAQPCPAATQAGWAVQCLHRACIEYVVRNDSSKITGIKVSVQFRDAVGDPYKSPFEYTGTDSVKPGKKHSYGWDVTLEKQDASINYTAWIEKLMYEDGSTWVDDGSRSCAASFGK